MDTKPKSARTETLKHWSGRILRIGDKMLLNRQYAHYKDKPIETEIESILPSGRFFKVKDSIHSFSINSLRSRGSNCWHGYYLTPLNS